jgi:hypothetical protein
MKNKIMPQLLVVFSILVVSSQILPGQIITNFGSNANNGGGWTYTSGTSTITGTEGLGDLLFGTPLSLSYSGATHFSLTANVSTAPTGTFSFSLEDNTGKVASASFFLV